MNGKKTIYYHTTPIMFNINLYLYTKRTIPQPHKNDKDHVDTIKNAQLKNIKIMLQGNTPA
jgi:hypothetical protein